MNSVPKPKEGRRRVVIEAVRPEIDCGSFAAKRVVGEEVQVEADIFTDGHDHLSAVLLYRHADESGWTETAFEPLVNDRWKASFRVEQQGLYRYTVCAWVDHFKTWQTDMAKKLDAGVEEEVDFLIGAELIGDTVERLRRRVRRGRKNDPEHAHENRKWALGRLEELAAQIAGADTEPARRMEAALSDELSDLMLEHSDRSPTSRYTRELTVWVDRARAGFSAWYELFPRSCGTHGHGTFSDCLKRLDYVAELGFDVVYLPPIHPIGRTKRKGANNTITAGPDDPGSPWAIGAAEGGHTSIHPELGDEESFRRLVTRAEELGMEIALDIAFQASPDHPWVASHPEWFRLRPDGTVQFAENPPKKYEDIYPLNFESEEWEPLWDELRDVFLHWIDLGVKIFRVDNPHTKPFAFWEWLIAEIRENHPDVIFLSEAFTRPKVMYRLAKLGFTQSYTYFAWRNTKWELEQYFTELTQTEVKEFFRPNLWPNTPDILTEFLQAGGRPAFMLRFLLAATLGANYGIYGPAFELHENVPLRPGSEEYLNSEKYQIRHWDLERNDSLRDLIGLVNRIRQDNPALQSDRHLKFHGADNEAIICYSKRTADHTNVILVAVNLDPYHAHAAWTSLDLEELGLEAGRSFQVHDLLTGARYYWQGAHNFVMLEPGTAHVFAVEAHPHTEQDFPYYM
ncbi:MAG: alpha-1,4-glucan--maltose-1-phosphate maltosyltransferase [Thermoleophilia bacterium]